MTQLTLPIWLERRDSARREARAEPHSARPRHYQIGPVAVSLRSNVPSVSEAYHELYRTYETPSAAPGAFQVLVAKKRSWRTGRRYYHVLTNCKERFATRCEDEILSLVQGAIHLFIARHRSQYLQIHASALSRHASGVICPGEPGSGKSTLAAALLARGWSYFSDEFALIDPHALHLVPYPKAISVRPGSLEVLRRLGLPIEEGKALSRRKPLHVVKLNPLRVRPDAVATPCPIRMVVFPQYGQGRRPAIEPMSRAEAVFELSRRTFNFLQFRKYGLEVLVKVVRGARCYRLCTGDPAETCRLVEEHLPPAPQGEA